MPQANPPTAKRYMDPKVDLAFKRVFGQHIDVLKSFLNALLPLPADAPIESLEYLSPEQAPQIPYFEKFSIVDVKCKDAKGRIFIVEMQMIYTAHFGKRILFGGSQAYVRQLQHGQSYELLQPVYALALLNSVFEPDTPDYYHHYKIIKVGDAEKTLEGLEFVFIELPKFKPETLTEKRMASLWLRFLNETGNGSNIFSQQTPAPQLQNEPDIAKALELMEVAAFSDADIAAYDKSLDAWRTHSTIVFDLTAKGKAIGLAEGRAEGKTEGLAIGKAEGLAAGKAEGLAEGKAQGAEEKAQAIAKQLLATGMSAADVAKVTGVDAAAI
ncbi:MAG: hypothetical protein RL018_851 [Pseudomonadota bacterium]